MIAMGAGGLDVAVAMGGGTYYITCPKIVKVELTGKLSPWVAAKDVILEVLKRLSVKGGVGKVIEYCGEGVKTLPFRNVQPSPIWVQNWVQPLLFSHLMKLPSSSWKHRAEAKFGQNRRLTQMPFMMKSLPSI